MTDIGKRVRLQCHDADGKLRVAYPDGSMFEFSHWNLTEGKTMRVVSAEVDFCMPIWLKEGDPPVIFVHVLTYEDGKRSPYIGSHPHLTKVDPS